MYPCPHCGKPGVSMLRRAFLGPARATTCTACGGKVGVPWGPSMLAVVPFAAAALGSQFVTNLAVVATMWVVGAAVMMLLFFRIVPLIKK